MCPCLNISPLRSSHRRNEKEGSLFCILSCGTHHPNQRPAGKNPRNPVNPDSKPGASTNTKSMTTIKNRSPNSQKEGYLYILNLPTHQVEALFWPTACCNPFRFCVLAGMVLDHAPQFVPLLKQDSLFLLQLFSLPKFIHQNFRK